MGPSLAGHSHCLEHRNKGLGTVLFKVCSRRVVVSQVEKKKPLWSRFSVYVLFWRGILSWLSYSFSSSDSPPSAFWVVGTTTLLVMICFNIPASALSPWTTCGPRKEWLLHFLSPLTLIRTCSVSVLCLSSYKIITSSQVMAAHTFNPSTWEAQAGLSVSSRPSWSTEWVLW